MSSYEDRIAARRKNFKKTNDNDDARRKREEEAIQIRKQQKEQAYVTFFVVLNSFANENRVAGFLCSSDFQDFIYTSDIVIRIVVKHV